MVDEGKGDGIFVNTAGIGVIEHNVSIAPARNVRPGDAMILSGDIGRQASRLWRLREGLAFETEIESDCAGGSMENPSEALLDAGIEIHCLRDLTRGGLSSGSHRDRRSQQDGGASREAGAIPVREDVAGACEILGLDPLYLANEGRFAAFMYVVAGRTRGRHPASYSRQQWHRVHRARRGWSARPGHDEDTAWYRAHHRHAEWRTVAKNLLSYSAVTAEREVRHSRKYP